MGDAQKRRDDGFVLARVSECWWEYTVMSVPSKEEFGDPVCDGRGTVKKIKECRKKTGENGKEPSVKEKRLETGLFANLCRQEKEIQNPITIAANFFGENLRLNSIV